MKTRSAWSFRRVEVVFRAFRVPDGLVAIEMMCQHHGDEFRLVQYVHESDCWLRVQELVDDAAVGVFGYTMHAGSGRDFMPTFHTAHPVDCRAFGVQAMLDQPMQGFIVVPPRTTTEDHVRRFLLSGGSVLEENPAGDQNSVQS